MTALSLRERNKHRVNQRIITAAVELFKSKGCSQTTMDDIADRAEISRGTLFNYFPSKDALLLPWGQEILERHIQPGLADCLRSQPSTLQALDYLFCSISDHILATPDVIRAFVREALKTGNKPQAELARTGMQELFIQVLQYGQGRGEVRKDLPVQNMAAYLGALHTSLLFSQLESGAPEDTRVEMTRLLDFIAGGLAPTAQRQ